MSDETIISVKWNPAKFRQIKGNKERAEAAENIGVSAVYLDKLIQGKRRLSIEALEAVCVKANATPNEFFEIVKKSSTK